jgi:hypothetical protein
MNGLRFKVGELAIVAVDIHGGGAAGNIVEILKVGPIACWASDGIFGTFDYETSSPRKEWESAFCMDIELRKIDPPAEPASLKRHEECEAAA